MSSNTETLKSYANKSKAKRGLQAFGKFTDEQMENPEVGAILFQHGESGKWSFDTEDVRPVLLKITRDEVAQHSVIAHEDRPDVGSDDSVENTQPAPSPESEQPAAPADDAAAPAPVVFGALANTLQSAPAAPAPVASAPRAQSRSTYTIEKNRPEQNGIKRPSAGGLCRAVWDACDELREKLAGAIPGSADIRKLSDDRGWNRNNTMIEFYQWRKYNGVVGRTPKAEEPVEAKVE